MAALLISAFAHDLQPEIKTKHQFVQYGGLPESTTPNSQLMAALSLESTTGASSIDSAPFQLKSQLASYQLERLIAKSAKLPICTHTHKIKNVNKLQGPLA